MAQQPALKPGSARYWWHVFKLVVGLVIFIVLVLLTYFTLYTIPAILLLGFLLVYMIIQWLRPPKPIKHTFRPEEENPRGAVRPDQIDRERLSK